jgi:hypothetical protein
MNLYQQVHETVDKKIPFNVKDTVIGPVQWKGSQQALYNLTANNSPIEDTDISDEYNAEIAPITNDIKTMTGIGPGELAVASVVSGHTDTNRCRQMVSGQGESYDVSWPSSTDVKYKFEVKKEEGGSVRVGTIGSRLGNPTVELIRRILENILEEYNILDEENRKIVDDTILNSKELVEPVTRFHKTRKNHDIGPDPTQRRKYEISLAKRSSWSVEKFVNAIKVNLTELPLGMLFGEDYEYGNYSGDKVSSQLRAQALIMSLKAFLECIENTHLSDNEIEQDALRVKVLKDIFKKYYSSPESEKKEITDASLDAEAEKVDRKLLKLKHSITGGKLLKATDFFKSIRKSHLLKDLQKHEDKIKDGETVRELFPTGPTGISGLFIVNIRGWSYIPEDKIKDFIEITTFSQGRPKIALKKNQ